MRGTTDSQEYIAQSHAVLFDHRVTAELNMNRYHDIVDIDDSQYGTPTAGGGSLTYYKDRFPLESVVLPSRPKAGICVPQFRNYTGTAVWHSQAGWNLVESVGTYNSSEGNWTLPARLYYASSSRIYKFFRPAGKTSGVAPYWTTDIEYVDDGPWANKIVIKFEDTVDSPTDFEVFVKLGGVWVSAFDNPTIDSDGQVTLWANLTGQWVQTRPTHPTVDWAMRVEGIRIEVSAMSSPVARPSIIEISPRVEFELTTRLQSWNDDRNLSEGDSIAPIGTVSSNSAQMVFSNDDYIFDPRNYDPGTAGISDFAMKFLKVKYEMFVDAEWIEMFNMYVDHFEINEGDTATATLFDEATLFQGTSAPDAVWRNVTPTAAIWRLLDSVGFNDIVLYRNPGEREPTIPYFYCESTETVWDVIKTICISHQYAVTIDARGRVAIMTKNYLYNPVGRDTQWTFRGEVEGLNLTDIVTHEQTKLEPVNRVSIKYRPQTKSKSNDPTKTRSDGGTAFYKYVTRGLYSPNAVVLLGISRMAADLNEGDLSAIISNTSIETSNWGSYSGYFLIDSEVVKFDGLEFSYIDSTGTPQLKIIKSSDHLEEINAEAIGRVHFTGKLCNLERGQFGTNDVDHPRVFSGWLSRSVNTPYITQKNIEGNYMLQISKPTAGKDGVVAAYKDFGGVYTNYTTRLMIYNGKTTQRAAGIVIWAVPGAGNYLTGGWYVELRSTEVNKYGLDIMPITSTGALSRANGQAFNVTVKEDTWYTVNVILQETTGNRSIMSVYVSGVLVGKRIIANAKTPYVALMSTSKTHAQFDYVTASTDNLTESTANKDMRGIVQDIFKEKDSLYQRPNSYIETFDNYIREMFVQDVRFTKGPALDVKWYPCVRSPKMDKVDRGPYIATTTDIAGAISYVTPYSARIAVGNVGKRSVVLSEEDSSIYPYLFGNIVEQYDELEYETKDKNSIRRFGEKKLEFSGDDAKWITTVKSAEELGNWVLGIMSDAPEQHVIESFGNPLVEEGDRVTIKYAAKGFEGDEDFVVTDVSHAWNDGLETQVTIMKVSVV